MMSKMEILKKFKSVEYRPNYADTESEKNCFIASLVVDLLSSECVFQNKSIPVHFN